MDLVARRAIEKRIIIAAAEGLIASGCSVSVVEGDKVLLIDSKDPIAIDVALHASGEPGFLVKRVIDGTLQEGWVDFVGAGGIEVTADENLEVHDSLQIANALAVQLGVQRTICIIQVEGVELVSGPITWTHDLFQHITSQPGASGYDLKGIEKLLGHQFVPSPNQKIEFLSSAGRPLISGCVPEPDPSQVECYWPLGEDSL